MVVVHSTQSGVNKWPVKSHPSYKKWYKIEVDQIDQGLSNKATYAGDSY